MDGYVDWAPRPPNWIWRHGVAQGLGFVPALLRTHGPIFTPLEAKAIVQGHCHHKAIMKFEPQKKVVKAMGLDVEVLESGCCGMAGAFGYDKAKYDVSIAAGERVLLPRVRSEAKDTLILADGFSCRSQIQQETDRCGLHLAEALKLAIDHTSSEPYPERRLMMKRRKSQRMSMIISALIVAAIVIGLVIAGVLGAF